VPLSYDLSRHVPDVNYRDDATGDLESWVSGVLQPTLDLLLAEQDRWNDQVDVDVAESDSVDAMLRDLGNPFAIAFELPLDRRRLLVRVLVDVYKSKGSAPGLVNVVRALTALEVSVVFPATADAWDLGVDVLGDVTDPLPTDPFFTEYATLGPAPGFMRYSFQIEVPRVLTADERTTITEIVKLVKPAHTHFIGFIEPNVASVVEHWELDVSYLHDGVSPLLGDEVDLHGP